tara:strand:- start:81 stop:2045 length:1965 start_codon:yes stop_codon:yes gene_type:complete
MVVNNPNFYGQSTTGTPEQIEDGVDFPHTGIIKALSDGLGQNYAISGFNITIDSATQIDVGAGVILRDGAKASISAVNNLTLSATYTNGYHLLVVTGAGVIELRNPIAADKVPQYSSTDTIIAVITHTGNNPMPIQYLTVRKTANSLSIARDDGGTYTEMGTVSCDANSLDITTTNSNADINLTPHGTGKVVVSSDIQTSGVQYNQFQDLSDDIATGYHTIAHIDGWNGAGNGSSANQRQRGIGTFFIRNTDSSRHQSIILTASHLFGAGNGNGISIEHVSHFSTIGIDAVRIKEASTYDGAVLQIQIANATNNIEVFLKNNFQDDGWILNDAVADADNTAHNNLGVGSATNYSSFSATATIDLTTITGNGQHLSGKLSAGSIKSVGDAIISGNIGIGTSSPQNRLQVSHTGADSNNGIMIVREDTSTADTDLLGGIGFDSTDGNVPSSVLEASAYIAALAAEDHGTGDKGGDLTFGTAAINENDDTVSTEHMRILSDGKVGIGTAAPEHRLHIEETSDNYPFRLRGAEGNIRINKFGHIQIQNDNTSPPSSSVIDDPVFQIGQRDGGQLDISFGNISTQLVAGSDAILSLARASNSATGDKQIGFLGATAVPRQTAPSQLNSISSNGIPSDPEANADAINLLRTALINLGLIG